MQEIEERKQHLDSLRRQHRLDRATENEITTEISQVWNLTATPSEGGF